MVDRKTHRAFRQLEQFVQFPSFGKLANGAGAEEDTGFDGNPGCFGGIHNRRNVDFQRARCALRLDVHFVVNNLARQTDDILLKTLARAA